MRIDPNTEMMHTALKGNMFYMSINNLCTRCELDDDYEYGILVVSNDTFNRYNKFVYAMLIRILPKADNGNDRIDTINNVVFTCPKTLINPADFMGSLDKQYMVTIIDEIKSAIL